MLITCQEMILINNTFYMQQSPDLKSINSSKEIHCFYNNDWYLRAVLTKQMDTMKYGLTFFKAEKLEEVKQASKFLNYKLDAVHDRQHSPLNCS